MQHIPPEMRISITELSSDDALLELYEFDLTKIGGIRYRFFDGLNQCKEPLIWQGNTYGPYPVKGEGFSFNGKGPSGRPTITLSNLFGLITGIASQLDSAIGGLVVRRIVSTQFLDAVNFPQGNPNADPSQEIVTRWIIEQMTSLNSVTATFMLATPSETDGLMLPGRAILSDICNFCYRSEECGYKGPPVADEWGKPTTDPLKDKCGKRLSDCKLRKNESRIGAFVSTSRIGNN
ncbi:phage minor tail protein L [Proteus mirabilis]|uniref:Phage minor tail protein L n=2 Tax=Morganellaceae TaxID=1903414 RepID=A0A7D5W9G2_PROMI|nr:phage minor tail protein L [Proteus mirabilis]MBA7799776.1 phage minor tail protein L [Citrobacter sp. RHBSTW-01065]ATC78663.1 phage minor tail protein L [Proteus mirabilis]EJD6332806.1 phage minor tail protein L [Proteus mirabilis]EJD6351208.1 phage minor tail protein L [Proteus mirabilis]EJD6359898.1 phage minor tail protein L [Proteus mirabilis]